MNVLPYAGYQTNSHGPITQVVIRNGLFILVGLLALTQTVGLAQTTQPPTLQVGEALPRARQIVPKTEQFVLYTSRDGHRQFMSFLTRTVERDKENGQDVIRVVQRYESVDGVNIDSSVVAQNTLAPLTYRSSLTTQREIFDFSPDRVTGYITPTEGEGKTFDIALEERVYNAVILDELIQALPLDSQYVGRFRDYNPGKGFGELTVRVTGSTELQLADGSRLATWVVSLEGGPVATELWIEKETQQNVRIKALLPNGGVFWRVRLYANSVD